MVTPITHPEIVTLLAGRLGITEQQVKLFLQAQAELAYEYATDGYAIAGIGALKLGHRPEQKLVMQFGPKKGQAVTLPPAKKLKFWIAKSAKETVLKGAPPPTDVTQEEIFYPNDEDAA